MTSCGRFRLIVLFLAKSEGVGKLSLSRNDVELHLDAVELSSSLPSVDKDRNVQIVVATSPFPGADRGGRKWDGLAASVAWSLAWVLEQLDIVILDSHVEANNKHSKNRRAIHNTSDYSKYIPICLIVLIIPLLY